MSNYSVTAWSSIIVNGLFTIFTSFIVCESHASTAIFKNLLIGWDVEQMLYNDVFMLKKLSWAGIDAASNNQYMWLWIAAVW